MKIITLTSDLGLSDHYVAALKASILRVDSSVQIVDVTHQIRPFDSAQAAYVLKSCFHEFPEGTVHLVAVDTEPIVNFNGLDGSFPCILKKNNQYIVANNNGFFGAFLGTDTDYDLYRIDDVLSNPKLFNFPSKNMYVPAALRILAGEEITNFASKEEHFKTSLLLEPTTEENIIVGTIAYIDSYGNAITNIHESLFEKVGKKNPFVLYMRKKEYYIDVISGGYNEVNTGAHVAIFNERRFIEIAINRGANIGLGGAEKLLGLKVNDKIRIEFQPQGSKTSLEELF